MTYLIALIVIIVVACVNWSTVTIKAYQFLFELIYIIALHIYTYHSREMTRRKLHNQDKIMDVEIKRTNDLLSNLVPPPVLQGIKND